MLGKTVIQFIASNKNNFLSSNFSEEILSFLELSGLKKKKVSGLFPQSKFSGIGSNNWHLNYKNRPTFYAARLQPPLICSLMMIYDVTLSCISCFSIFLKLLLFLTVLIMFYILHLVSYIHILLLLLNLSNFCLPD